MKPKGLGELCAATSNLTNQTGIGKTDILIIHKLNLTSSHFKKTYKWATETRGPKSNSSKLLCLSWLPATFMMKFFRRLRAATSVVSGPSGRNSNSSEMLCMSLLSASIKRIGSKTTEKRWKYRFPNYTSIGAFCCHGNQSFDPICLQTLCSLSPNPSDAIHKI